MARDRKPAEPARADAAPPSFEEAIERLQAIVEELEGGTLSLEESIARYEEGVRLSRQLGKTLDAAEKRIERLVEGDDGTPGTEPMDLETGSSEEPARPEKPDRPAKPERRGPDDAAGELPF